MDANIKMFLLGPFRAERAGKTLTDFKSNKVRALLAYLAVEHQHAHHRDVLADLLWPHSSNSSALALLRDALSNIRLLLDDREAETPCIDIVEDTLQFHHHEDTWLDIVEFTALTDTNADARILKRAVALCRGEFMEGFSLSDNLDFEAWLLRQREGYRHAIQQTLYKLTTHHLQDDNYPAAQATARHQVQLDAYAEEAHRQLLRALALDGQRNQALTHYADYCDLLDKEIGVNPDIRTTALYQRICDHRLSPGQMTGYTDSASPAPDAFADMPPFVGREAELARLEENMWEAQRGQGQVLLITGEAGSGKTSLIQTFIRRCVAGTPGTVAVWGASNAQVGDGDPYLPFREMLRLLTGDFDVQTLPGSLTPALAQQLEALTPTVTVALQRFGPDLLNSLLPTDKELVPPTNRTGPRTPPLPAALCDQIERVFHAVARRCTLVLVIDDLHWVDSGTLNLLAHLGRRLRGSRILLLLSYRTADATPTLTRTLYELQRYWGDITLDLDHIAGRDFVDAVLDSTPNALDPTFREQLYRQTNGHALFTVALIQQLQTEGTLARNAAGEWTVPEKLDWHYLPPQVEAVIAARIAKLPEETQTLLTVASVEGETFTAEVVARALGLPSDTVQRALSGPLLTVHLVAAQGLERAGSQRIARYRFHHSLFQQYLYDRLDPVQHARYHEAVGRALETLYADQPEAAMRLAYHFEAAGLLEEAVAYLARAGRYAYRLSAPAEAINLYRRGLALLEQLPESDARDRQELALQMGLNMPLFAAQGWGAPERVTALNRAYTLARRLDATPQMLPVLRALADVNTARAKHRQALTYAERLSALNRQVGDDVYEVLSHRIIGISHFFLGHYQEARMYLEKGIACYDALLQTTSDPAALPDIEETVFLWAWLPLVLFALGYPEQAIVCSRQALERVRDNGHVHARAKMLTVAGATFSATIRQPQAALRYADELLTLATDYHLPAFKGWAVFYRGWSRAALGQKPEGLAEMVTGWEQLRATGTEASLAYLFTLLTEVYAEADDPRRSAEVLTRAFHLAEEADAHAYLAEIYRMQGKHCMAAGEEAEPWFLKAIDIAQRQGAKLWELRATVSLAHLWRDQGREKEAYEQLSAVYDWFTEGFDRPDLVRAKSLLNALEWS